MDDDKRLVEALRETLLHIAGVSGAVAKRLRSGDALTADLGLEDVDLEVLAGCQRKLGDRLRLDRGTTRIVGNDLRDLTVGEVYELTIRRALGRMLNDAQVAELFALAQAGLRGAVD